MRVSLSMIYLASLTFVTSAVDTQAATSSVQLGPVSVARTGTSPLLLWNCSSELARLQAQNIPSSRILSELESSTISIMKNKLRSIGTAAKTVSVRAVFDKTGATSETYGTPTFAGVEQLVTVSAPVDNIARDATHLSAELAQGKKPAYVVIQVTGALSTP